MQRLDPGDAAGLNGHPFARTVPEGGIPLHFAPLGSRRALAAAALPARAVPAHASLTREGEDSDRLHVFLDGWACRYKTTPSGDRQILALILPGDIANLDTLMFGGSGYGICTLAMSQVVSIPCDAARHLVETRADLANAFTRLAMRENGLLSQWAFCLGSKAALERLAHLLCELAVRLSGDADAREGEADFDLPLTQEQLSDVLALTPVHLNRTLQQLRADGLVETQRCAIRLPDIAALRRLAGFDPAYLRLSPAGDAAPAAWNVAGPLV